MILHNFFHKYQDTWYFKLAALAILVYRLSEYPNPNLQIFSVRTTTDFQD